MVWVDQHGDCLFKYALFRLRDASAGEDAIQETTKASPLGLPVWLWYLEHLQAMRNTMRVHADDPLEMSLPNLEGLSTAARERIKRNFTNTK